MSERTTNPNTHRWVKRAAKVGGALAGALMAGGALAGCSPNAAPVPTTVTATKTVEAPAPSATPEVVDSNKELRERATTVANQAALGVLDDMDAKGAGTSNNGVAKFFDDGDMARRWAYIGNKKATAGSDGVFGTKDDPTTPEMRTVIDYKTGLVEVLSTGIETKSKDAEESFTGATLVYQMAGNRLLNSTEITTDTVRDIIQAPGTELVYAELRQGWGFDDIKKEEFGEKSSVLFSADGKRMFANTIGIYPSHGETRESAEERSVPISEESSSAVINKLNSLQPSVTAKLHAMTP